MKPTGWAVYLLCLFIASPLMAQSLSSSSPELQSTTVTGQQIVDLPLPKDRFRPRLTLQSGLKIAEDYIKKNRIEITSYYLLEARFILYGDPNLPDNKKTPAWFYWWLRNNESQGDYVEIVVFMDGKAMRIPSM